MLNTYWLTAEGELYKNLLSPVKVAHVDILAKRAVQLKQKMMLLSRGLPEAMVVGDNCVEYLRPSGGFRSWLSSERPSIHHIHGQNTRYDVPKRCRLAVPPFGSNWNGWCSLRGICGDHSFTCVLDENLHVVWRALCYRDLKFSWDGMTIAFGKDSDDRFVVATTNGFEGVTKSLMDPPLHGRSRLVILIDSRCAIVESRAAAEKLDLLLLCQRANEDAPWCHTVICKMDSREDYRHYHALNRTTILITCVKSILIDSKLDKGMLICLKSGAIWNVTNHRRGTVFWTPQISDLTVSEAAYVERAIAAIDELPDDCGRLNLVRAVFVGFLLEDARLVILRAAQSC